jgi:hypothetical protein
LEIGGRITFFLHNMKNKPIWLPLEVHPYLERRCKDASKWELAIQVESKAMSQMPGRGHLAEAILG